jgi:cytochrome bd ubiquinol oxidase subunit II
MMAANAWFAFIVFGFIAYVALDGYDLGVGMLCLARRRNEERVSLLEEVVAPVWDGNESWVLLIGVGLWGGFPAMFGGFLPAVYIPIILMLFSLAARGVSIEMLSNAGQWRRGWGRAFMGGSLSAAFFQGVAFGTLVQGVHLGADSRFEGGTFDFLTGFTVLTGLTVVALHMLAGAAMVKLRSSNEPLRASIQAHGRTVLLVAAGLVVLSGALLPVAGASSLTLDQPFRVVVVVWMSVAAAAAFATAWWSFGRTDHANMAFVSVLIAEVAGVFGLVALLYPMILPPSLTIAHAASPSSSLLFLLGGFGFFVLLAATYNVSSFWLLRPRRGQSAPSASTPPTVSSNGHGMAVASEESAR